MASRYSVRLCSARGEGGQKEEEQGGEAEGEGGSQQQEGGMQAESVGAVADQGAAEDEEQAEEEGFQREDAGPVAALTGLLQVMAQPWPLQAAHGGEQEVEDESPPGLEPAEPGIARHRQQQKEYPQPPFPQMKKGSLAEQ